MRASVSQNMQEQPSSFGRSFWQFAVACSAACICSTACHVCAAELAELPIQLHAHGAGHMFQQLM